MSKAAGFLKSVFHRVFHDFRKYWWVALILIAYVLAIRLFTTASCPVYQVVGLPCAGCGMSRATRFVLTGQFARAYYLNPLSFLIVFFGFYCLFCRYISGKKIRYFVHGIIVIFILLLLFYIVRMYVYFPNRVPYVYNYNNIMENLVPGYRAFIRGWLKF